MSEDDIDNLIVNVVAWVENTFQNHTLLDNDELYEELSSIFYEKLEKFCTKERNYN